MFKKINLDGKNLFYLFLSGCALAKLADWLCRALHISGAAVLEGYYHAFRESDFWHMLTMSHIPPSWPSEKITSYAYDFSVLYAVSQNMDVALVKSSVMPANILPYGPLAYLFFHLFSVFPPFTALAVYRYSGLLLFLATCLAAFQIGSKSLPVRAAFMIALCLCATPLPIFLSSGNVEIFLFSFCLLGLLVMDKRPLTAAALLGVAAAIKYYPILFCLEFLRRKQYRAFFISCALAAGLFFIPFFFMNGSFADNFAFTLNEILSSARLCEINTDVFCHFGGLSVAMMIYNLPLALAWKALLFKLVSGLILVTGLYAFARADRPSHAVLALICIFALVPQVSVFYKLSYLLIYLALALRDTQHQPHYGLMALSVIALSTLPFYFPISLVGMKADFSLLFLLMLGLLFKAAAEKHLAGDVRRLTCRSWTIKKSNPFNARTFIMIEACNFIYRLSILAFIITVSGCAEGPIGNPAVPQPAKAVDVQKYLGRWYEIARYEASFQEGCEGVTADYSLRTDGKIKVINSCHREKLDAPLESAEAVAYVVEGSDNAKLRVSFFWPFYGNYWVLDHGDAYDWAIVGEPTGRYLWLLFRAAHPAEKLQQSVKSRAAHMGYDLGLLRQTKQ